MDKRRSEARRRLDRTAARIQLGAGALVLGGLLMASGTDAQVVPDMDNSMLFEARETAKHRGRIVALDRRDRKIVIETPAGEEIEFNLVEGGSIAGPDARLEFDALRLGQEIALHADLHQARTKEAESVTVVDPGTVEHRVMEEGQPLAIADTVTVVTVDVEQMTLLARIHEGKSRKFRIDDDTAILSGTDRVELGSLRPGDRIVVMAPPEESEGEIVGATRIEVVIDPRPDVAAPPN